MIAIVESQFLVVLVQATVLVVGVIVRLATVALVQIGKEIECLIGLKSPTTLM